MLMEKKTLPDIKYISESITTLYEKNPTEMKFCSLTNISQEWEFSNISENSIADLLRTTTRLKIDDEITIIIASMGNMPVPFIVEAVMYNDPYYEVDTSALTAGEIPEYVFFTDTKLSVGITDNIIPNHICDFSASDDLHFKIQCTWSDSTGLPEVLQYNLINTDTDEILATDIISPYDLTFPDMTDEVTINLGITISNSTGNNTSNSNSGTALYLDGPSFINDFNASDGLVEQIEVTFTPASGTPEPTHDLVNDDTDEIIAIDISSGYIWNTRGVYNLRIDAKNAEGTTPSNINQGSAYFEPSLITDFNATDTRTDGVLCTWSTADGLPEPTYDLYRDYNLLKTDISSGYLDTTGIVNELYSYNVKAKNSIGENDSNIDIGTKYEYIPVITYLDIVIGVSTTDFNVTFDTTYQDIQITSLGNSLFSITSTNTGTSVNPNFKISNNHSDIETVEINEIYHDTSSVSLFESFMGCNNMISFEVNNSSNYEINSVQRMLSECTDLSSANLGNLISNVTSHSGALFRNCTNLGNIDISDCDFSGIEQTSYMFQKCTDLSNISYSNLNFSSLTNADHMFSEARNYIPIITSSSLTKNYVKMFYNYQGGLYSGTDTIDVSGLSFSNIKSDGLEFIFEGAIVDSINFGWSSSEAPNCSFRGMFQNCTMKCHDAINTTNATDTVNMYSGVVNCASPNRHSDMPDIKAGMYWTPEYSCPCSTPPNYISDFQADDREGGVQVYFTEEGPSGVSYNLQENGLIVAGDISSGYFHSVSPGTRNYAIRSINNCGKVQSNLDSGSSIIPGTPPGSFSYTLSSDSCEFFTHTWSSAGGDPSPTYDLYYGDGSLYISDVSSPYNTPCPGGTIFAFYIVATNTYGSSESNLENMACPYCCTPGNITFTSSGTWTVPEGVTSIDLCMVGGGGAGGVREDYWDVPGAAGGGYAGSEKNTSVSVNPGQNISITIGRGGIGRDQGGVGGHCGESGTSSSFGSTTANGGSGGCTTWGGDTPNYSGDGGSRTGCAGTRYDGDYLSHTAGRMYGGQASSFGNGGRGAMDNGVNGGVGAGGGGMCCNAGFYGIGSDGGRGECRISWDCNNKGRDIPSIKTHNMTDEELEKYGVQLDNLELVRENKEFIENGGSLETLKV